MDTAAVERMAQEGSLSMAWTQTDIDTLQAALLDRKGARTITFADQSVTFESLDDMLKLLAIMRGSLASTVRYAATSKGV
jgi:hypothetical protein